MGRKSSFGDVGGDDERRGHAQGAADHVAASERAEVERRSDVASAMRITGIEPEFVYAFERTGLLVTLDNRHLFSAADLDEWDDAVAEYRERNSIPGSG